MSFLVLPHLKLTGGYSACYRLSILENSWL
jgi:hypothetical protein